MPLRWRLAGMLAIAVFIGMAAIVLLQSDSIAQAVADKIGLNTPTTFPVDI